MISTNNLMNSTHAIRLSLWIVIVSSFLLVHLQSMELCNSVIQNRQLRHPSEFLEIVIIVITLPNLLFDHHFTLVKPSIHCLTIIHAAR